MLLIYILINLNSFSNFLIYRKYILNLKLSIHTFRTSNSSPKCILQIYYLHSFSYQLYIYMWKSKSYKLYMTFNFCVVEAIVIVWLRDIDSKQTLKTQLYFWKNIMLMNRQKIIVSMCNYKCGHTTVKNRMSFIYNVSFKTWHRFVDV
jgi:hypothetical protein